MIETYFPLQFWNKCWKPDDPRVTCRRCRWGQHVTDAGAFQHAQGCSAHRMYGQYPFRELGAIVEQKIQDGLF